LIKIREERKKKRERERERERAEKREERGIILLLGPS